MADVRRCYVHWRGRLRLARGLAGSQPTLREGEIDQMNEHLKSAHEHTAMAKVAQMKDDAAEYGQQMTRAFEEMALYAQDLLADNDMLKAKLAEHGID